VRSANSDVELALPIINADGEATAESVMVRTNVVSVAAVVAGGAAAGAGATPQRQVLRVMVVADFAVFTVPAEPPLPKAAMAGLRALATNAKTPEGSDLVKGFVALSEWGVAAVRGGSLWHESLRRS
jgi:hypothetical protein